MNRKIVQIASTSPADVDHPSVPVTLTTALCDDGTVWCIGDSDESWRQLPDIPQEGGHDL